jgi:hypothetical protein
VNCRIANNTVVDINNQRPGPSWIRIGDHKNGAPSRDCVIRNNIATAFSFDAGVTVDHNLQVGWEDYVEVFRNPAAADFHLKAGSVAIDAGSSEGCPSLDKDGRARPRGSACDLGAFEFSGAGMAPMLELLLGGEAATGD